MATLGRVCASSGVAHRTKASRRVILIIALTQCFDRSTRTRRDDTRGVMAGHVIKLRDILARPDAARTVKDVDTPGFRLHPLKGELEGLRAVTVRANWRVIFRFADSDAFV